MAKQIIERLIDDIDGSEATQTVMFAIDGRAYEIDLNDSNAETLRAVLADYQAAGKLLSSKPGKSVSRSRAATSPKRTAPITVRRVDNTVWMATARAGMHFHDLDPADGTKTVCGRQTDVNGVLMPESQASRIGKDPKKYPTLDPTCAAKRRESVTVNPVKSAAPGQEWDDVPIKVVRAWAESIGKVDKGKRGRLSADVVALYHAEHGGK